VQDAASRQTTPLGRRSNDPPHAAVRVVEHPAGRRTTRADAAELIH